MEVAVRIKETGASLTGAERRVAEVILSRPHTVAFGTVAELAAAAGSGAATVVRLATKLGYDGFTALQASVQHDLSLQLRPAAERIRELDQSDPYGRHAATELANVQATLDAADSVTLKAVIELLADPERPVSVVSGEASMGVARQFAGDLSALRAGVDMIDGNEVAVQRRLALGGGATTVVAIDLRRYDRWLLDAVRTVRAAGAACVAMTDSVLSPLAALADHTFVLSVAATGPFESHVGTLALMNRLTIGVAERLQESAGERLAAAEQAWRHAGSLTDG